MKVDVTTSASTQPSYLCQADRSEKLDIDVRILGYSKWVGEGLNAPVS